MTDRPASPDMLPWTCPVCSNGKSACTCKPARMLASGHDACKGKHTDLPASGEAEKPISFEEIAHLFVPKKPDTFYLDVYGNGKPIYVVDKRDYDALLKDARELVRIAGQFDDCMCEFEDPKYCGEHYQAFLEAIAAFEKKYGRRNDPR